MGRVTDLPVFIMKLNPNRKGLIDGGFDKIAFVEDPAIQADGIYLNEHVSIKLTNNEKQQVIAPLLIPDKNIYREDKRGRYYITFPQESINDLRLDAQDKIKAMDVFKDTHNGHTAPAFVIDEWIIKDENDKAYTEYKFNLADVPIGTWMVHSQIIDKDFWEKEIKSNKKFKYSIEAFMNMEAILNENKNKINENMKNETKLSMPAGEHTIGDKIYVIGEDGEVLEIKDLVQAENEEDKTKVEAEDKVEDKAKVEAEDKTEEDKTKVEAETEEDKKVEAEDKTEEDKKVETEEDKKVETEEDKKVEAEDEENIKSDLEAIYEEIAKLKEVIENINKDNKVEMSAVPNNKPFSGLEDLIKVNKKSKYIY